MAGMATLVEASGMANDDAESQVASAIRVNLVIGSFSDLYDDLNLIPYQSPIGVRGFRIYFRGRRIALTPGEVKHNILAPPHRLVL
jgi:hypothetical protein